MTTDTIETLVCNRTPEPLVVVLEPWADQFTVRPGTDAKVRSEKLKPGDVIEVVVEPDRLVIWGVGVSYIEYDGVEF